MFRSRTLALAALTLAACRGTAANGHPPVDAQAPGDAAGAEVDGWVESSVDGIDCSHPKVSPECASGWCKVPAGCFIMGSPETELWRGESTERQTAVTLTHAFEIGQYELTFQRWSELVTVVPSKPAQVVTALQTCTLDDCPLRYATWFEALAFANLMSERHAPPLSACYVLEGCTGELGTGMRCTGVELTASTPYDCEGYRLPTEAEWEYAARAGTRTAYYSGDISTTDPDEQFLSEPNLDPIAWYASNSESTTHPTAQKSPNRWLLYDMLGNVSEWTSDQVTFASDPAGPLVDPATPLALATQFPSDQRVTKGGNAAGARSALRAASRNYWDSSSAVSGEGFRLVRTLP